VIDRLEMFARALVARVGRDDGRGVELRHAFGIDEKLELDFTRGSVRLGRLRSRRRIMRWRLINHSALDNRTFRAGLGRVTLPEEARDDLCSLVVLWDSNPVRRARGFTSRRGV